jgi:hypothetical protein
LSKLDQADLSDELEPLTVSFLSLDNLETYMELLGMLIQEAKVSDVNDGAKKQGRSQFNARTVAILGALNGRELKGSLLPSSVRVQYFYQDDEFTKSLCTPFSNLILFATTIGFDDEYLKQVQSITNANNSPNNWIALRAAFEFDMNSGAFRYETKAFQDANDLVNESLAAFIEDTTRRFSEVFEASPDRVCVSQITRLCEMMAERTNASAAWLVREMVSRYIAKGAKLLNVGREQNDCYGRMELGMMEFETKKEIREPPASKKVLEFDSKVDIEGLLCSIYYANIDRKVVVILDYPIEEIQYVPIVRFKDEQHPPDHETAEKWLKNGRCANIEMVDAGKFSSDVHFLLSPPTKVILGKNFV